MNYTTVTNIQTTFVFCIVCNIKTDVQAGESDYPMSISRDSLRSPYKDDVSDIKSMLLNITDLLNTRS